MGEGEGGQTGCALRKRGPLTGRLERRPDSGCARAGRALAGPDGLRGSSPAPAEAKRRSSKGQVKSLAAKVSDAV